VLSGAVTNDDGTASFNFSITSSRGPRMTTYTRTCVECGNAFAATSPRRYCEDCGTPRARVRRHRAARRPAVSDGG